MIENYMKTIKPIDPGTYENIVDVEYMVVGYSVI